MRAWTISSRSLSWMSTKSQCLNFAKGSVLMLIEVWLLLKLRPIKSSTAPMPWLPHQLLQSGWSFANVCFLVLPCCFGLEPFFALLLTQFRFVLKNWLESLEPKMTFCQDLEEINSKKSKQRSEECWALLWNVDTYCIIKVLKVINQIQNQNKFIFSERVVGRNWTEKIVVLYSDSRWQKKVFYNNQFSHFPCVCLLVGQWDFRLLTICLTCTPECI